MAIHYTIHIGGYAFDTSLITIEPVLFLYMVASYLNFPILQALMYEKVCTDKYNSSFCHQLKNATFQDEHKTEDTYLQSETSFWILKSNIALMIPSCFTVLFFTGTWGDKVGRKLPIILPIIGCLVYTVGNLISSVYMTISINCLMIGIVVNGLCGGYIGVLMAVYSYVTHVATDQNKTIRVAILEAMTSLAGTLGVFVSGIMLEKTSYVFVFSFNCIVLFIALLYSVLWVEDISADNPGRGDKGIFRYWFRDSLVETWNCVRTPRSEKKVLYVSLMMITMVILMAGTSGEMDILYLYTKRAPLSWTQTTYGYYKGLENFSRSLLLLTLLPILKKKMSMRDTTVSLGGMISKTIAFIVIGVASKTWMVFIVVLLSMFQGFPSSGVRSLMSGMVEKNEQGRLFSILAVAENIAALLASLMFNELYPATLHIMPGFCFLLAAGITVIGFCIVLYLHFDMRGSQVYTNLQEQETTEANA
ncbi:proton-coupled folate transporter-like [Gigantopelta aegis]|uniref:proton-coupled folate transporter-like n=1 Tax=Gigantopelta aegis TaxID=1735272 RepID=UPI001B889823|nr:proton-coupled folate transporter-like [Gigantopelta aegis]